MVVIVNNPSRLPPGDAPAKVIGDSNQRSNLRIRYDAAVNKVKDGEALVKHYSSSGARVGTTLTNSNGYQIPNFQAPTRWGNKKLRNLSEENSKKLGMNTWEFLDEHFPDSKRRPADGYCEFIWWGVDDSNIINFGRDYLSIWRGDGKDKPILVANSGTFWKNKLKGLDRGPRLVLLTATLKALKAEVETLKTQLGELGHTVPGGTASDTAAAEGTPYNYGSRPLKYNVGMVNEAYFGPSTNFQELVNMRAGGNKPGAVTSAEQLWQDSKGNKGMIWLYTDGADDTLTVEPKDNKPAESSRNRYAFQFHYNPSTVDMAWGGSPDVDVTLESSGSEKFNMLGGQTMASISIELVINRIFDMQYYGTDGLLKPGRREERNPYAPRKPDNTEQQRIYNYGTMYDVEYLLATILGYKLNTRFRAETSDIGFLNGRPVDLHLGHRLRYWGYISDVAVTHAMFDERMVPIFSTLRMTFNRIPDYPKG